MRDTWSDSTRSDPGPFVSSEYGVDSDGDGDIEAAWFNSGLPLSVAPGHLTTSFNTNAICYQTIYFAPSNSPVALSNAGDQIKITWRFTPTDVRTFGTQFPLGFALVHTPAANRLTSDGPPGSASYGGYAFFTTAYSPPGYSTTNLFQSSTLSSRTSPNSSSDLFNTGFWGHSIGWTARASSPFALGGSNGTPYIFEMTLTRDLSNGLQVASSISCETGSVSRLSFYDANPSTFNFNTACMYGNGTVSVQGGLWGTIDSTLFKVDFLNVIPPRIEAVSKTNDTVFFTWSAKTGQVYQVQFATSLTQTNWTDLGNAITATNSFMTSFDSVGPDPQRFYRILLPAP